jgi:hypothetical protein
VTDDGAGKSADDPTAAPPQEPIAPRTPEVPPPDPKAPTLGPGVDTDAPALASAAPTASTADLIDAVGARVPRRERKRRDRDLDKLADAAAGGELETAATEDELDPVERADRRGRRRTMVMLALAIALGVMITAFVILGRLNKDRYFLACTASEIRAEQGRGFPPWGSAPLAGAEWKPIAIPPDAECHEHEVDDLAALTTDYLAALVEQAQLRLTAKTVTEVDLAAAQLEQALLLSREPSRRDHRSEIGRLLGDVEYWRATARLRSAIETLGQAATQFDAAADRRPHHVGDSAAWAEHARRAAATLGAGPGGLQDSPPAPGEPTRIPPPMGVALPVETPDAAPAQPTSAAPIDAGLLAGGVLL